MGDGKTPGDGKTSPFGNGSGKVSNPQGSTMANTTAGANAGGAGNNFITHPSGSAPFNGTHQAIGKLAKPTNFVEPKVAAQKSGQSADINAASAIKDKGLLVPLADVTSARKELIGAGSIGDNRKPFRL